jgi:hypothetical protein
MWETRAAFCASFPSGGGNQRFVADFHGRGIFHQATSESSIQTLISAVPVKIDFLLLAPVAPKNRLPGCPRNGDLLLANTSVSPLCDL